MGDASRNSHIVSSVRDEFLSGKNPRCAFPEAPCVKRRLVLTLASAAVLGVAAIAYAYVVLFQIHPIGQGPAGPTVPRGMFVHRWTKRPVQVVGLGDSITAGFGASPGHGYFERLLKTPPDEFPELQGADLAAVLPNLRAENLAVSGSTSLEHVAAQLPRLKPLSPDTLGVILVTTGGNDLIHNYGRTPPREGAMYGATLAQAQPWINAFASRLETIITGIEQQFPGGCHIFLANIYDPTDGVGDIERAGLPAWKDGLAVLAAYNDVIARAAKADKSVHLVDIRAAFLGHGIHCTQFWRSTYRSHDPHYWYFENLEDPNDRGYDAIRRLFLLEMSKALTTAEPG
jgi:lysophospholipase L1-like esterase